MNNKFYVSLEAEELLKEKGCPIDGRITKAEAIDWLESNTGFIISEDRRCDGFWYYVIFQGNDIWYDSDCHDNGVFLTRWEAQEAGIIRVLTEFL